MNVSIKEIQRMIKESIANNPPKPIVVGEVREGVCDYLRHAIKNS
ncbi:hypothetical protein BTB_502p01550 (plasmid) [Bacillus thuringiensis Bt407]|uniref:Uncharacterized protein n=1 Tax=Bacillus thuringiensis T01-328 TaxID=1324966 RepID=A0AAN4HKG1_BACTU|nr:hypothetical protein [Bacillus thuringiensis]AFV21491.1 hypothetical protein BTB_502p01550 [Bacillus thuringiensis Bt407]ERI01333.1 hypothetical protein BTCBT_002921 [Bacillus thuringiensis T01-328]MEC3093200.1 hypothetical protein [Bacillus cereus]MED2098416.1 hypothetical protein [Bacillus thuringiensis]MED2441327.1 hypothetical protein [Bacillus thuringiensis]